MTPVYRRTDSKRTAREQRSKPKVPSKTSNDPSVLFQYGKVLQPASRGPLAKLTPKAGSSSVTRRGQMAIKRKYSP